MEIGKQYGQLTVVCELDANAVQTVCSCGNDFVIYAESLENGLVTNCGCVVTKFKPDVSKDGKGKAPKIERGFVFGDITIEDYLGNRIYLARCKCGNEVKVRSFQLSENNKNNKITCCAKCRAKNKAK